jgi:hypothetical protein
MGPPGLNGSESLHVVFAGYTPTTFGANLGGRNGAHALCDAAFAGSHFCTDWELDESAPPPVVTSAWVDRGSAQTSSRLFRPQYSTYDTESCAGWTSSSATVKPDGVNLGTGLTYTPRGGFASSFVGANDGGCEVARQLACCRGGTAIRFRGFTAPTGANLGGRSGARAMCDAAFSGSRFCTDWEVDQAAIHIAIPASGVWVDAGDSQPSSRRYHSSYTIYDTSTCAGWTSSAAGVKPDGVNLGTGLVLTPLGGIASSFVGAGDGGCENARPLACCDGAPPQ